MTKQPDPSDGSLGDDDSEAYSVEDATSLGETQAKQSFLSDNDDVGEDSPLAIIRKDNQAVSRARALVVLLLLLAALGTSYFVYHFTRQSELQSFEIEFHAIADRMLESFLADTGLRMSQAKTVAAGIAIAMRSQGTQLYNVSFQDEDWLRLTFELNTVGRSSMIAYSPYLKSDDERRHFEDYAARSTGFAGGKYAPCYPCGKGVETTNPNKLFEFAGTGIYKCIDVYIGSIAGNIPPDYCGTVAQEFESDCGCDSDPLVTLEDESLEDKQEPWPVGDGIFRMQGAEGTKQEFGSPPYSPLWQVASSSSKTPPSMYDQLSEPFRQEAIQQVVEQSTVVFSKIIVRQKNPFYARYGGLADRVGITAYYPILDLDTEVPVGVTTVDFTVENFFTTLFPSNSHMVDAVIENSCGQAITTRPSIEGRFMEVIGEGDFHDKAYASYSRSTAFSEFDDYVVANNPDGTENTNRTADHLDFCRYRLSVYPTHPFEESHKTQKPFIYAAITAFVFLFTTLVFALYDVRVRMRQEKIMESAMRTNNIVASLFPQNVRDRLYEQVDGNNTRASHLSKLVKDDKSGGEGTVIADFFPHCTVAFIDIAGFTAWSSEREPQQVFRLLESLYGSFDDVGRALDVFKVETIGDSYVAACGLPKARKDHAVVMVRFADQCLRRMNRITHELERFLGPSTGDLEARCGLHSGPVTAGILRGEKARFQLFGDTMNTASRMEGSGIAGRIHVSPATATELRLQGKGHWLMERLDVVHLKGKGQSQTFWAIPRSNKGSPSASSVTGYSSAVSSQSGKVDESERLDRLIDWNVEVLLQYLQPIVSSRGTKARPSQNMLAKIRKAEQDMLHNRDGLVVDEMTQILYLPEFDPATAMAMSQEIPLSPRVKQQLRDFVVMISSTYKSTPFHNFDHASHVV
eukprot:scaffold1588_cov222-Amphora_coffeaeformis.AAC.2